VAHCKAADDIALASSADLLGVWIDDGLADRHCPVAPDHNRAALAEVKLVVPVQDQATGAVMLDGINRCRPNLRTGAKGLQSAAFGLGIRSP